MLFNDALPIHVFDKGLQYCTIGDMFDKFPVLLETGFCTGVFSETCKDVQHSDIILKMYNSAAFCKGRSRIN